MGLNLYRFGAKARGGGIAAGRLVLVGVLAFGMAGCQSRGGPVPYDVAQFGAPDVESLTIPPSQQRIAPLDLLQINVFQVAELSGQFRVDAQGRLQLPLVGAVDAAGKLPGELAADLERQLGERYLRSPDITITVAEQAQQQVTVEGAVRDPGVVPIRGTTTLMRAIALVHGLSEDANPRRVVVFRTIDGQRMAAAFDLSDIRQAQAQDPEIYGNDIIVVEGSRSRRLLRDVLTSLPAFGIFTPLVR